jgi:NAD(P)-dependent dehydrogenase (short-subunit alcohol dehydrogenase family)
MSTANWFVTGVSRGFGRSLCEQLLGNAHRVVGTTRNGSSDLAHENLTVMQLDVTIKQP